MKTIREGVFETNSSSTHSLTMMPEADFIRWQNGDYMFEGEVYSKEEVIDALRKDTWFSRYITDDMSDEEVFESAMEDSYIEDWDHATDELSVEYETRTCACGEKITAISMYGYGY